MYNLDNINEYIKQFSYKSLYYEYFKKLHKTTTSSKNHISYQSIDSFISKFNATIPPFYEFIYKKIDESNFNNEVELYKNAEIDRKRWSDLINNKCEHPKKDTLFKLAISLKLSIEDTDILLATRGYCINHNLYRDKLLSYFFIDPDGRKILNLNAVDRNIKINSILKERHQSPLY